MCSPKEWLRLAVKPLALVGGPSFILTIVFAILNQYRPLWEGTNATLSWSVPLGMLAGALLHAGTVWFQSQYSKISVKPQYGSDYAYLVVRNNGNRPSELRARMTALDSEGFIGVDMTWRKGAGVDKVELFSDDEEMLKVVEGVYDQLGARGLLQEQYVPRLPAPNERVLWFPCTSAFCSYKPCGGSVKLEVVITADPKLAKQFKRTYQITLDSNGTIERFQEVPESYLRDSL